MSSSAAVSAPMPKAATSWATSWPVSAVSSFSWALISSLMCCQRRAIDRRVCLVAAVTVEPAFQVWPVDVVEAHVGAVDVLVLGEVVEEAFQADPVSLDRVR